MSGVKNINKQKNNVRGYSLVIPSVLTFLLLAVAFWQAIISNKATNATIKSLKIQDESMKVPNRAYVLPDSISHEGYPIPGKIHVAFKNTGNTPAYNLRVRGRFYIGKEEPNLISDRVAEDTLKQGIILGKNKSVKITKPNDWGFFKSHFEDIQNKKLFVFFFGDIFYDDIFGDRQCVLFCAFYDVTSENFNWCFNNNKQCSQTNDDTKRY